MNSKVKIERLATGVPGLDDVLGGGLPEFSFNLITGAPGCGKTTLAHQLMFALATPERPALYLTVLGEPPLKMLRYQQQFEFFDSAQVNRSIRFVNLSDEASSGDLGDLLRSIVAEVEKHKPAFVFVDSFRSLVLATRHMGNTLQEFVQQLGTLMTSWQATTFLIGEYTETDANPVFTVADGMIRLSQSVQRNSMVRKIEIVKMRGQPTLPGLHSFRISMAGIRIFPPAYAAAPEDPEAFKKPMGPRLSMGIPELDEMMCGGLPSNYSLLVAGPSGSGKSILASEFLAEGARCGETGVMVAFEENPKRSRSRQVVGLIESGKVGLVSTHAPDTSINEIVQRVSAEVKRLDAKRVVIDSLTGLKLLIAPTFQEDFRESLLSLGNALTNIGVTVLMTCELEDRYDDLRFSPFGSASLVDAIIVQRYIEVESKLLRVTAVVKVRASQHSNELRAYSIHDDGIHIGDALPDQEGLLGGRPTERPSSNAGPGHGSSGRGSAQPGSS
jgi:circadian clock protein KaiC